MPDEGSQAAQRMSRKIDNFRFAGKKPVDYLSETGLPGLEEVRQMLDGLCQGHY